MLHFGFGVRLGVQTCLKEYGFSYQLGLKFRISGQGLGLRGLGFGV